MKNMKENSEVYQNLSENVDIKSKGKWTGYLILSCLVVCTASFQFGYNIGATNLPTQLIQNFFGQKYFKHEYLQENYLEKKEIYAIVEGFTFTNDTVSQFEDYFKKSIKRVAEIKSIQLNRENISLLIKPTNMINEEIRIFKLEHADIEKTNTLLWTITNAVFVVGGMIGAFTSKIMLDFFGRKNSVLLHGLNTIIGAVLVLLSYYLNSPVCVIMSRFFYGIQGGMSCGIIPTYLTEISPAELRGATGVLHQLFLTLGIMISQLLGFRQLLGTKDTWHFLLGLPILPCIVGSILLMLFFDETPKALLSKGDETNARIVLRKLRGTDIVTEIELMKLESNSSSSSSDDTISIVQLFRSSELRWPLFTGLILQLTQQFCGINAIFFYSNGIFERATIQSEHIQYAIFATGVINVICTIVCVPLIDRLGRKPLLLVPMSFMVVNFILLTIFLYFKNSSVYYSYLSIVCIIAFIMSFAIGLGPIPFIYVAECFKQNARSAAFAVCMFTNWMANLILTLSFEYMAKLLGDYVFLVFALIVLIAVIVISNKVPETKGRSVEEIMFDFDYGSQDLKRTSDIQLIQRNKNVSV